MIRFLKNYFFLVPAGIITIAVIILNLPFVAPIHDSDSQWYISIAEGHIENVMKPFSGRFFHSFLAGQISSYFSADLTQVFLLLAVFSLFFFFVITTLILRKLDLSYFLIVPFFLLPLFLRTFHDIFLPDGFYLFLTAAFFLFVFYEMDVASLLTLFLLFLARESTILLGVIYLAVSLFRSKRAFSFAIFLVMVVSIFTANQINNIGLPNTHSMNNFSYVAFKVPFYFLNNVLGVRLWVNTLQNCVPIFKIMDLPNWRLFGAVHEVGFCGVDPQFPLMTVTALLTVFGVLPVVVFYLGRNFKTIIQKSPVWLIVALFYGLGHYLVGVTVTTGIERLAAYSWPAFLLVALFFMKTYFEMDRESLVKISLVNLFVAWLPFGLEKAYGYNAILMLFIIAIALLAYFYVFGLLKRSANLRSLNEGKN